MAVLADRLGVTMTEVALAWTLAKGVAAPIVGATKVPHFDAAVRAVDFIIVCVCSISRSFAISNKPFPVNLTEL